jgi:hypothetical protein
MFRVKYELGFYIREDGIPHSHRRENLRSYTEPRITSCGPCPWVHSCSNRWPGNEVITLEMSSTEIKMKWQLPLYCPSAFMTLLQLGQCFWNAFRKTQRDALKLNSRFTYDYNSDLCSARSDIVRWLWNGYWKWKFAISWETQTSWPEILKNRLRVGDLGTDKKLSKQKNKQTPWPLVRERTIPTERPPLVDEI